MSDPIVWSAFSFQASFWLSLCVAPLCFSHYHRLDSTKGEKAYWAATFSGVLHAILIVALCVLALYDSPELMSSSNFFQASELSQLCCKIFIGYILQDFCLSLYYWSTWPGWEANLIHHVMVLIVWWQLTQGGYAQGPATISMLCESSTPFVAMRWYLDKAGMKTGKIYVANGMLMMISFFIFRVCLYTYMAVLIYRTQEGFFTIPILNRCLFLLCYFGGAALQYFWFAKILRGAYKTLTSTNSGTPKTGKEERPPAAARERAEKLLAKPGPFGSQMQAEVAVTPEAETSKKDTKM